MKGLRLLAGVLLAASAPGIAAGDGPEHAVDAFHEALRAGDAAAALGLMAPEAIVAEQGALERTRDEYERVHLPADMAFSAATRRTVKTRAAFASGDLAWVFSEAEITGTFREKAVSVVSNETMVLRRSGRTWRIIHIHWSSASRPEPQAPGAPGAPNRRAPSP